MFYFWPNFERRRFQFPFSLMHSFYRENELLMGHLHDDVILPLRPESSRVFFFCANENFCHPNFAGISKLRYERKNEKPCGRSSRMTPSCKWPIEKSSSCSLHNIAADLAAEATSIFLSDIRSTVGDDIFAKFLNLKSENSMALVIDVSGSMSGKTSIFF